MEGRKEQKREGGRNKGGREIKGRKGQDMENCGERRRTKRRLGQREMNGGWEREYIVNYFS